MRYCIAITPTPLIPCRAIRQGNIESAKSILSNDFRTRRTAIEVVERWMEFQAGPVGESIGQPHAKTLVIFAAQQFSEGAQVHVFPTLTDLKPARRS
jgi:hypothetical protein